MKTLYRSTLPALILACLALPALAQPKPAPKPPEKTTLPPGEPAEGQPVNPSPDRPSEQPPDAKPTDAKPTDAKPVNPFGDFKPVIVPPRGPFRAPDGGPGPHERVSQESLMAFLAALPTKRAAWGSPEHLEGLKRTEDILLDKLRAMGHEPTTHSFKWARVQGRPDPSRAAGGEGADLPVEWRNIIVELPGTDLANEILLYGAHFDSVPNSPGADDNGSGTAGLLELARVLKGLPTRRTIRLVFFNVEEPGIIGATAYYNSFRKSLQKETPSDQFPLEPGKLHLVGMVSLEMLGYYSDRPGSQKSPIRNVPGIIEQPDRGTFIALATTQRGSPFARRLDAEMRAGEPELETFVFDLMPIPIPDLLRSDHRPFMIDGVPAIMLTDTANFRNPHYHQPTDTIETIDPVRFTRVVRGLAAAAYAIAEPAK
jgi:hypothetical protein